MSTYYTYYIGYKVKDKIFPLGPYNSFGKLKPVLSRSGSFASDIYESFYGVDEKSISDELRAAFEYKDYKGNSAMPRLHYLDIDELPNGDYVKTGYFLKEDVAQYEKDHDLFNVFYDKLSPTVYAAMVQDELMFGAPKEKKDCEGTPYTPHAASDYMYYAYEDYQSEEYEAHVIRSVAKMLNGYGDVPEDAKLVALLHIG